MAFEAWAQLVETSAIHNEPIQIQKKKYIIGRSLGADLCMMGNKLVSGTHCFILKDDDGTVWIQDTSTNGTLINLHKKLVGVKCKLNHGDEIHLVYKKSEEHLNVSYLFQDLAELAKEKEFDDSESTLDYSTSPRTSETLPDEDSICSTPQRKRPLSEPDSPCDTPLDKKHKNEKTALPVPEEETDSTTAGTTHHSKSKHSPTKKSRAITEKDFSAKSKADVSTEDTTKTKDSCEVPTSSIAASDTASPAKSEETTKASVSEVSKQSKSSDRTEADNEMEETLMCIICQEILHDCVSCQPCMHSFCGGCYSDWMKRSAECPSCRKEVDKVSKNHMVNSLVDVFLKAHPDKKRPAEEIKELDAKNIIKEKSVKPRPERRLSDSIDEDSMYNDDGGDDEEEDDDDDDEDEEYENSEEVSRPVPIPAPLFPAAFAPTLAPFGFRPAAIAARTICRQCPGHAKKTNPFGTGIGNALKGIAKAFMPGASGTGVAGPSRPVADENGKVMPTPPDFVCPPSHFHILCSCCGYQMPDRREDHNNDPDNVPPMQCTVCVRNFCHMYWGCQRAECLGCLGRFKELNFGKKILDNVLENPYESTILKYHLEKEDIDRHEFLQTCCEKLENGDFSTLDQIRGFNPSAVVCYSCGLRNLRELAFQYRKSIKPEDLPAAVKARPNCHWGKNCRTQRNNMGHAARYNHICEQTKPTT